MKTKGTDLFDIDGVLADFEGEFCKRFGYDNRGMFDLERRYPYIDAEIIREFVANPFIYLDLWPIFGGKLLLEQCYERAYEIKLVTSRPIRVNYETLEWLEIYNIPYSGIFHVQNKHHFILEYNSQNLHSPVKMLVDDNPRNLYGVKDLGIIPLCWEQPWNNWMYPKARYNDDSFCIEVKMDRNSKWKHIWSK